MNKNNVPKIRIIYQYSNSIFEAILYTFQQKAYNAFRKIFNLYLHSQVMSDS
jgi:hypothetical protein